MIFSIKTLPEAFHKYKSKFIHNPGWFWSAARFCFTGFICAICFYIIYYLVLLVNRYLFSMPPEFITTAATSIALAISMILVFILNKYFTFLAGESRKLVHEIRWFIFGRVVSNFIVFLPLMYLLVDIMRWPWYLAVTVPAILAAVLNFLIEKIITFRYGGD
jgi:putative flippase GtrA